MSSVEEQEANIEKQMILNLQLDKMTQQAFKTRQPSFGSSFQNFKGSKRILTKPTEQAIKDYNKQFKVVQYQTTIDENGYPTQVLDEEGKPIPITAKNQIPVPELEAEPLDLEEIMYEESNGEHSQLRLGQLDEFYNAGGYKQFEDLINDDKASIERAIQEKKDIIDKINLLGNKKGDRYRHLKLLQDVKDIDDFIFRLGKNINRTSDEVVNIHKKEDVLKKLKSDNENYKANIKAKNDIKMKAYTEAFNILNTGSFDMEKKPEESEEDYLQRLQDNAEEKTVDETLFEVQEFARKNFKDNMKELVRNDSIIETVANEIKQLGDDKELEIKNTINKTFPRFKQLFIELYGKENKVIGSGDIFQFIKSYVSDGADSYIKSFLESKRETSKKELPLAQAPVESIYPVVNSKNGEIVYFMPIEDLANKYRLLWSNSLNRGSFRQVKNDTSFEDIKKETGIGLTQLKQIIKPSKSGVLFFSAMLHIKRGIKPITFDDEEPPTMLKDEHNKLTFGWGIKPEQIPEVIPFGKLKLLLHKLYYKNNLVVKHKDGSNIIGLPNLKVSDEFVKVIMKLVKGDKIKNSDLNTLKTVELHLYNRLITLADLHKIHQIDGEKTVEHLKHRLEVLTGEIDAGNDSKEIISELHKIVHSLKDFGAISIKDAGEFIKQFKINFKKV